MAKEGAQIFRSVPLQPSLPSPLEAEIVIVLTNLAIDLAIGGLLLVGVFFDKACFQVGVEVWRRGL
jgi:hypothetical protein